MGVEGSNDNKPEAPKSAEKKQTEEESEQLGIVAGIGCGGLLLGIFLMVGISALAHVSADDKRLIYVIPFAVTFVSGVIYLRLQRRGVLIFFAWATFMLISISLAIWVFPSK